MTLAQAEAQFLLFWAEDSAIYDSQVTANSSETIQGAIYMTFSATSGTTYQLGTNSDTAVQANTTGFTIDATVGAATTMSLTDTGAISTAILSTNGFSLAIRTV